MQTCARFQPTGIRSDSASEQAESILIPIPPVTGKVELIPIQIPVCISQAKLVPIPTPEAQKSIILISESIPFLTFSKHFIYFFSLQCKCNEYNYHWNVIAFAHIM